MCLPMPPSWLQDLKFLFWKGQDLPELSYDVTFYFILHFPDSGFFGKLILLLGVPPKAPLRIRLWESFGPFSL